MSAKRRTKAQLEDDLSAAWECLNMTREKFAAIEGKPVEHYAPMFFPEVVSSLLFRAACGDYDHCIREEDRGTVMARRRRASLTVAP